MDVRAEARRLASVATFFVWVGWIAVVYAVVAGVLWWIDLASRDGFSFLEALGISLNAVGGPIFLALHRRRARSLRSAVRDGRRRASLTPSPALRADPSSAGSAVVAIV